MKKPRSLRAKLHLAAATVALIAAPSAAAEVDEAVVPPSNSAATQYTEAFPTPGGDKKTDGREGRRRPAAVLGRGNVRKLDREGSDGRAVVAVTAATAPEPIATEAPEARGAGEGRNGAERRAGGSSEATAPTPAPPGGGPAIAQPEGTSGIGEVLGEATGLSSAGGSGTLLLLVILATIAGSLAYLWRQKQQVG